MSAAIQDILIAPEARERVRVPNRGDGTTVSFHLHGDVILSKLVQLDSGGTYRCAPAHMRVLGPVLPANVVQFQPRKQTTTTNGDRA